ncbi:MAG: sugar phosphate isomerase/epimerase [Candidatus Latescibacteria bacterium]|nr:sugar phosphate isomerase/epimerase [Candidatus Latescibacterota bacterium]
METTVGCTTRPYGQLSYSEAYSRIAEAGYSDVAVFANEGQVPVGSESSPAEVAAVRNAAHAAGVVPSMLIGGTQLGGGLAAAVDAYKRLIDNAAALGTTWLLDCGTSNEAHFDDYFELMRQSAPHADEVGVNITMKPHGGISLTVSHLLAANDNVSHAAFGICFDPGNIIYYTKGDLRPETGVLEVAPVVTTGIIKDCTVIDGVPDVMVTPGDGLVDFHAVLSGLVGGGFDGPLYVECVGGKEPDEVDRDIAFARGYVEGILSGL